MRSRSQGGCVDTAGRLLLSVRHRFPDLRCGGDFPAAVCRSLLRPFAGGMPGHAGFPAVVGGGLSLCLPKRRVDLELNEVSMDQDLKTELSKHGIFATSFEELYNCGRKSSVWLRTFVLACCSM